MKTYGQYCAVAKALDVVGDRWTLLIVRELLLKGACRYTDLRAGLPGIATNLLADRLRALEAAGVVSRRDAPPPVATALFELTPRGAALEPILDELGRWGVPYMAEGPASDDEFRGHWLAWPVREFLSDHDPDADPVSIAMTVGEDEVTLSAGGGEVLVRPGHPSAPDAALHGDVATVLAVLSGHVDLESARASGLRYDGPPAVLGRLQPAA
jgi:DNA-binding HxlR family transcriptional regulator